MAPLQLYSACKPVQNCAHPPWALGNFFGTLVLRVSRTLPVAAAALHVHTAMLHHICTITVALHMFTRLCCTTSVQSLSHCICSHGYAAPHLCNHCRTAYVHTAMLHHICAITVQQFKLWKTTLRCHVFKLKDPGNNCNIIMAHSTIVAVNVDSL